MRCYTIGHSNHHPSRFIELLGMHNITLVIDVRSSPYSKYMADYNKDALPGILASEGIEYVYFGDELGGRTNDPSLMTEEGQTDYAKVMVTKNFKDGIAKVLRAVSEGENVVLMCSEKEPLDCHRFVLVSRALSGSDVSVFHILGTGELKSNSDLEAELLARYNLDNRQTKLFGERKTSADIILEAYLIRGREIAYKPEGGKA